MPEFAELQLLHMSIHEIQALESEMIEEMDSLRQIDTNTGDITYSHEYRVLEKQYILLLEAYECLFKKAHIDSQVPKQGHNCKGQDSHSKRLSNLRSGIRFLLPFKKCTSVNLEVNSLWSLDWIADEPRNDESCSGISLRRTKWLFMKNILINMHMIDSQRGNEWCICWWWKATAGTCS